MRTTSGWVCCALMLAACTGEIADRRSLSGVSRDSVPVAGASALPGVSPTASGPPGSCANPVPPAQTRLVRLTHRQYQNAVHDLTGLELDLVSELLPDPHQAGFDRGIDLQIGDVQARSYRDLAESVAQAVVADPTAYARVLRCAPAAGDSCVDAFITGFGKRVLRRPLTAAERSSYLALFKGGPALVDSGDDFQRGVRVTLEALLQSPKFLYRTELSADPRTLDSYEIASRLSFLLVNTTPDDMLLKAAETKSLTTPEAVAAQARRLLTGERARETVRDFHHQWLDLDVYANKLTKDPALYPSVTPELAPVLQSEVERFVDAVSFEQRRGLTSLYTAPFSFVNNVTAALYGVKGQFGDALQRVELDPTQRAGILTQIGFLATRAFSQSSSPIHRGVFIQRRLLCTTIPNPPPNIPGLPNVDGVQIRTTRQQVDQHTSPAACSGCHHTLINPVGFGLENYDAVGRFRSVENGVPVDASGELSGTASHPRFASGVELARAVASTGEARSCYARNWFRYVLGREETGSEACGLNELAARLADDSYTAVDLLADLAQTPSFRSRTAEVP